jgi:hypothetical protein
MEMDWGWTIPALTFLSGQISIIGIEWFRHSLARDQKRNDARSDFQRQTLINLQEALAQYIRSMRNTVIEYEHLNEGRPAPKWPDAENPRLASSGLVPRMMVLSERVDDAEVRQLVQAFFDDIEAMFFGEDDQSLGEVKTTLKKLQATHDKINKQIGTLLRAL